MEKIYLPGDYPDLLAEIEFSSDEIFEIIKPFQLNFLPIWNCSVENRMSFPMFVKAFYIYLIRYKTLPTQQIFFDFYLHCNKSFFDGQPMKPTIFEGLQARIFRSYPSFVRDIHFNKYVKENLTEANVLYNLGYLAGN